MSPNQSGFLTNTEIDRPGMVCLKEERYAEIVRRRPCRNDHGSGTKGEEGEVVLGTPLLRHEPAKRRESKEEAEQADNYEPGFTVKRLQSRTHFCGGKTLEGRGIIGFNRQRS